MEEILTQTEVSVIEVALAKENVTNQVIQSLKENYLGLTINGLDDKVGFKKVEDARKECKRIRNLATNICKVGREEAISIQRAWIAKEKEVVAQISEVEDYLETQSNAIKEEEKRILFEAAQKAKLPARKEKLASIGITVPEEELLACNDEQFNALFNEFYEKHLAEKAEKLAAAQKLIDDEKAEQERKEQARIAEEKLLKDIEDAKEQARLKAEEESKAAIAKAEREKAEAEERERKAKAKAIEDARIAAEKAEADKAEALRKAEEDKQKAIAKLKREQEEKEEAERKAKEEATAKAEKERIKAEKKAARLPEKNRLLTWTASFKASDIDTSTLSEEAKAIHADIEKRFVQWNIWAVSLIENL